MGRVIQEQIAVRHNMLALGFTHGQIQQNTTGTVNVIHSLATNGTLNVKGYVMPYDGSVFAVSGNLSATPTAGTLRIDPLINGTLSSVTATSTRNNQLTSRLYASTNARGPNNRFQAGDVVQLRFNTTSDFAPNNSIDGAFHVFVLLENVTL